MTRQFVQQMADGDAVEDIYLVVDKQMRANRNGNIYLQLELHDRSDSMSARLWNAPEPLVRSFESGDFLLVPGHGAILSGRFMVPINSHPQMRQGSI